MPISRKAGERYPCYDANGNIMQKLDAAGAMVMNADYDPFGNVISGTLLGEYGFSTKPLIGSLGCYYYGYRYYDPLSGRWLNRDPIGEEGFNKLLQPTSFSIELLPVIAKYDIFKIRFINEFGIFISSSGDLKKAEHRSQLCYIILKNNVSNSVDYLGLISCSTCRIGWAACRAIAFATTAACNAAVNAGCYASCTGGGIWYLSCVLLCQSSGRFGCGVVGLLLNATCDSLKDICLQNCCE